MFKSRQEILVVGELVALIMAWVLCVFAAAGNHQDRSYPSADNALAESTNKPVEYNLAE